MEGQIFLHRYRLSLGRNGLPVELHRTPTGITYRGHEIDSGREVAIELVPWPAAEESATARVLAAAASAKQIRHVNIPALHDFGIENDQLVYVSDYFDGHTAEAWVAARGPLSLGAILRIALQVVGALGAASFHRIQHPALNPANIIFVPGQTAEGDWPAIKVLHFLGPNAVTAGGNDGRAAAASRYASPEQLEGAEVDFASTIFSLGCTMWFLLTGVPPALPGAPGVRSRLAKLRGVPKILRHLLGRMLRVNPAERPQDPVVLQAYLQTCLARAERREALSRRLGVPLAVQPKVAQSRTPRAPRKWPVKPLAIAALLLLCALLAALAVPRLLRTRQTTRVATAEPVAIEAAPPAEGPAEVDKVASSPAAEKTVPQTEAAAPTSGVKARAQTPAAPIEVAEASVAPPPEEQTETQTEGAASTPTQAEPPAEIAEPAATAAEIAAVTPSQTKSPTTSAEMTQPEITSASPRPVQPQTTGSELPAVRSEEVATTSPATTVEPNKSGPQIAAAASPSPIATATPRATKSEVATSKTSAAKKSNKRSVAAVSSTHRHSYSKTRLARSQVRRGRLVPSLHIGQSRAELVGTTADGRWILMVASSGERIIVPPPPGFAH